MLTASQNDHSNHYSNSKNITTDIQNSNGNNESVALNEEEPPEVDIHINNVVCNFSVRCHLNLRQIATNGMNVVYKREQSMISMKIRKPRVTASIWSSGRITCTGATTEDDAKKAARRISRILQKMGFKVKFNSYRIVNVLGSCNLPFGIKIHEMCSFHRDKSSYEPELHPGATYRMKDLKAVLKIFQTGAITITAPSIPNVQTAVERIYPIVFDYKKPKPQSASQSATSVKIEKQASEKRKRKREVSISSEESEESFSSEEGDLNEDYYSDKSE